MDISVIVPVYNVEKYIGQCIESLCNQTLKNIEIILVDDGSPDNSGNICDEYAAKDDRITVIHKKNGGVGAARNDGLAVAKGEYVIFVDSDDYVPEDAYEKLYNKAVECDADIAIGDVYRIYDDRKEYAQFYRNEFITEDSEFIDKLIQADFYHTYCPLPPESGAAFGYGGPWNKIVRRSMLEEHDIKFDLRVKGIFDDIIYTAHILAVAKRIVYINTPVYNYRILENSITQTYKANMPEINSAIFESWQEFIAKYGQNGKYDKAYYANVLRRMEQSLLKYFFNSKNPKSNKEVMKELRDTIRSEPYFTAAKCAELSKLRKGHKLIALLMRTKSAFVLRTVFCLLNNIKKA